MRKICLDTDFLVALLRGSPEAARKAHRLEGCNNSRNSPS
jgi:predicted nucleic acid-binding protein